jgi:Trk-type K+ transport system membrane component
MSHIGIELLGWAATGVFVGSYFFARPSLLRGAQMLAALLWVTYGVLIDASPVIVANVLVFSAAAWTALRKAAVPDAAD